jgi:hypothetical protein
MWIYGWREVFLQLFVQISAVDVFFTHAHAVVIVARFSFLLWTK